MKYCNKCDKQTPTKIVGEKEECMVCGAEIVRDQRKSSKIINERTIKSIKELCETDKDTGGYKNAQSVGTGVLIGLAVLITGILFSIGGIGMVFNGWLVLIVGFFILCVVLWVLAS